MPLGSNKWGKSEVRVSKVLDGTGFIDVTVQVLLEGDVSEAHTEGNNRHVLPTDTMLNTIYGLAQEHLNRDLEAFGAILGERFLSHSFVTSASVSVTENMWHQVTDHGYIGGGSERRIARVRRGDSPSTGAGVSGLVVLKPSGSAFEGFPRDEFTVLEEKSDRLLATSITADWAYAQMPVDTSATWHLVRKTLVDRFFSDWSASVQHQGYLMGEAVLAAVGEISEISFRLPNRHHLPFDLTRFDMEWDNTVFHPVSEPYGDIYLTVTREP